MKRYFSLIILSLFITSSFAQDSSKAVNDELKHGIQFQVDGVISLINFAGYAFSYRYLFNQNTGLRFGVYALIREADSEITNHIDNVFTKNPKENSNEYRLRFSAQFLTSIINYNDFALIIGGGPFYSFVYGDSYSEDLSTSFSTTYKSKTDGFTFGAELISGVEYRLTENIIISGEYGIILEKEKSETKSERKEISEIQAQTIIQHSERDRLNLAGSGVKLGLAIFF